MDQSPGKVEYFCGKLYSCNQTKGSKTKKRKLKKKKKNQGISAREESSHICLLNKNIYVYICVDSIH